MCSQTLPRHRYQKVKLPLPVIDAACHPRIDWLPTAQNSVRVSFQITIMKVLAGSTGGHLALVDLRNTVAVLISSGRDWNDRTKCIAARSPDLDIFSQAFVVREPTGWKITSAGRDFLAAAEKPAAAPVGPEAAPLADAIEPVACRCRSAGRSASDAPDRSEHAPPAKAPRFHRGRRASRSPETRLVRQVQNAMFYSASEEGLSMRVAFLASMLTAIFAGSPAIASQPCIQRVSDSADLRSQGREWRHHLGQ